MSSFSLLQILHVDQAFFQYNGKKTYNCIVSDSFGSQGAQIVGLPLKFSKKQKLPIIAVIKHKIDQDNLVILKFITQKDEVERILGNPKRKFVVIDNQPLNSLQEYINQAKMLNTAQTLNQFKQIETKYLSIRELNSSNMNSNVALNLKAKVLYVSNFKASTKDDPIGQYFNIQLIDKKGDQILAAVFNDEKLREEIQVGQIYEFQDFEIKKKYSQLHKYSIIFKNTTRIQQSDQIIKPIGCTIEQVKSKPIGSIINLMAFIQVEGPIEHQLGKHKDQSRKQIILQDQTGIILLNIWQKDVDIQTLGNKIIAISNLSLQSENNLIQLTSTGSAQFNCDEKDLKDEPEFVNLLKIKKEFKIQINSNSQQLLQEKINKLQKIADKEADEIEIQNTLKQLEIALIKCIIYKEDIITNGVIVEKKIKELRQYLNLILYAI
ncbi:hypothetical protein pb186bvf_004175 [Paramecium bursaria]